MTQNADIGHAGPRPTEDGPLPGWGSNAKTETINGVVLRGVEQYPDRVHLDISGELWTYRAVYERAAAYAAGLIAAGVRPGDRVATVLDNNDDAVTMWFGINLAGAISVPVNTANRGEYLRHQLADSGAEIVVAESDYATRIFDVADGIPDLRALFYRGPAPSQTMREPAVSGLPELARAAAGDEPLRPVATRLSLAPIEDLHRDNAAFSPRRVRPEDLAVLIYTSGTTGPAKGCMASHNYMCNIGREANRIDARTADTIVWCPLPMFHMAATAAVVLATTQIGARTALIPHFSLSNVWPEIERTGATEAALVGAMIPLVATMPDTPDMLRCRGQLHTVGGGPYPPELARIFRERFGVHQVGTPTYSESEATFITSSPPGVEAPWGSWGRRNNDFDVRIFDDDDREVPDGQVGEIVCRPQRPHVMFEGYWRRPEATQAVMRNLWFHTGDLGRFDADGWLHFVDRKKDYLRHRGENISSQALEDVFRDHPAVVDVAAHAVASELGEDDVKVTIVLKAGASVTPPELCEWSIDKLPYFAVPRYIEFRSELPMTPTGKSMKYLLRQEGVTKATWDRDSSQLQVPRR